MKKARLNVWILASRPKTLGAAVSPVVIGTAMAYSYGLVNWFAGISALLCSIFIQIGTNFANDYFDYIKGTDTEERIGPTRATQAGLVKPESMKLAFIFMFFLSAIFGLYLVSLGGLPIIIIGLLSIISGILYTGGPYPLGYNGLGDLFVLIFFGYVAVGGTFYIHTNEINSIVILAGTAPGLFSTAILTVNNLRDIATDTKTGKRTLAVRFGIKFARFEYLVSIIISCFVPVLLYFITGSHAWSMISVVVLIFAYPSIKAVFTMEPGPEFNEILAITGKLLLLYSLIFSIGWVI